MHMLSSCMQSFILKEYYPELIQTDIIGIKNMLIVIMVFAMPKYSLGYDVSTSPHIYKFFLLKVKISIVFIHIQVSLG